MTLAEFNNLLRHYLDGQSTPDELALIDRWYDSLNAEVVYQFTPDEQARLKARMWAQIEAKTDNRTVDATPVIALNSTETVRLTRFWQRPQTIAAALVFLLLGSGLSYLIWQSTGRKTGEVGRFQGELALLSQGLSERQNNTDKAITLRLSDGSTVYLTPQSTLRVANSLARGERLVYLTGDAFFTIAKDPRRPFRVITEQIETQVLGTSFWVHAGGQTNKVDVEVTTGKVQVYERTQRPGSRQGRGVVLTPNQMVTVTNSENWQTGLVAHPAPVRPDSLVEKARLSVADNLVFENTSLSVVCQRITDVYGIDMDLAGTDLASCTFSGNLSRYPLYTQLDLICAAINASYHVRGTHILISGRGCAR